MNKMIKSASNLFFLAGVLWVLESVGEMVGGYVEDFNSIFDYLSELTFGFSYAAIFLGAFYLKKLQVGLSGGKFGWLGNTGLFLLGLAAFLLTSKAVINVVYHGFIGDQFLFAEGSVLNPFFLIGVLASLLGMIVFAIACMVKKVLPWWAALLFILSIFFVFVPVIGKYLAAAVYALIGFHVLKKQEKSEDIANKVIINH